MRPFSAHSNRAHLTQAAPERQSARQGETGDSLRFEVRGFWNFELRTSNFLSLPVALFLPISLEYVDSLPTLCYPHWTRPLSGHFATIGW
jgi:hypothetical protein